MKKLKLVEKKNRSTKGGQKLDRKEMIKNWREMKIFDTLKSKKWKSLRERNENHEISPFSAILSPKYKKDDENFTKYAKPIMLKLDNKLKKSFTKKSIKHRNSSTASITLANPTQNPKLKVAKSNKNFRSLKAKHIRTDTCLSNISQIINMRKA